MNAAPVRFTSLPAQVAAALRGEIQRGTWTEWLPGERTLTASLQVSRKTLRKALALLRREGLLEATQGLGSRIVSRARQRTPKSREEHVVALLTPEPLEQMRPYTSLWVNHLKSLLIENGARLHAFEGRKFFTCHPAKALERLTAQQPAGCWLLANSTEATQRWFERGEKPCVVAGSCHSGVDLPHVDLDHYALCRHAAGVLLAAGHRRVALFKRTGRAGDAESEAGFTAGVRGSPHPDAVPLVVTHEQTAASLKKVLERLLGQSQWPTALLVSNGASYLTVVSVLAQCGLRVPQEISVVSRDDEPFLGFLVPPPTRYAANPKAFAKKLLKPLLQSLRGEPVVPRATRIMPVYAKGESLAPPAHRPAAGRVHVS